MSNISLKRLTKELKELQASPPVGISVIEASNLKCWKIQLCGPQETLYEKESFILQLKFSDKYPLESPEVIFIESIPIHPHVYSNGHICLSILYDQWTPALTISSVCLSIQSMLSSCKEKVLPSDDEQYVKHAKDSPKKTMWAFHDDKV